LQFVDAGLWPTFHAVCSAAWQFISTYKQGVKSDFGTVALHRLKEMLTFPIFVDGFWPFQ
jgi:hypothetical protein